MTFHTIFTEVLLPLCLLVGIGVLADRALKPDLQTLSNLNFHIFVPALAFVALVEQRLSGNEALFVFGFNALHFLILLALCGLFFRKEAGHGALLTAAVLFNNCGNVGIPFARMAFGDEGVRVMAMVMVFQNALAFTFGIWLLSNGREHGDLLEPLKAPVVWAVVLASLLGAMGASPPAFVMVPLRLTADGLVPVALITLGVQISRAGFLGNPLRILPVAGLRLVVSPLLALGLLALLSPMLPPLPANWSAILVCASAMPTAVNVFILALRYNQSPALASEIIFWTTLLGTGSVAVWLAIVG